MQMAALATRFSVTNRSSSVKGSRDAVWRTRRTTPRSLPRALRGAAISECRPYRRACSAWTGSAASQTAISGSVA
ncbi:hypothetical protein ADL28_44655 [Streptomyces violaceusniger]|uniref:Uncharacterized protein n=1 Tax=Streptomyces violaceusniger TaxID=68280 RepID=A0A0X3VEP0_STRVO|nr:hypothetical protein ADL28_44655 [Streptomyces violaceusniger]